MRPECPECGRHEYAVLYALYRPELAPAWLRMLSLGFKRTVKPVVGYCLCCPHTDCGCVFCLSDGGPRDTWRPHPNALGGRSAPQPGPTRRVPQQYESDPEPDERDPAEGHAIRTMAGR